jgi:hypothetical protein
VTRCLICDEELALHDSLYCELSGMAARPIHKISDLYPNELENILRALINFKTNVVNNTMRVTDYGIFPDTRGITDLNEGVHDANYPTD